jgi:C4-dicarboxylate transporter DctM subunit
MTRGKMTDQLVDFFKVLLGWIPGFLGVVTVVASAFFGAISGSSPAAVATIGKVMHPAMLKNGYDEKTACGLICSSGNLAIIIPPSITMILYSSVTNVSVGKLFVGGFIPGLIISLLLIGYMFYYAKRHNIERGSKFSGKILFSTSVKSMPTLLMPILILGGIYAGVFTPTEAAIAAVFYALLVTLIFERSFKFKDIIMCLRETFKLTTQVLIIMSSAAVFSVLLTIGQVPQMIAEILTANDVPVALFLLICNILFLFLGMFIDPASAIVALMPLLAPIAQLQGINLIHFGIMLVINLAIGMCTPPFGLNLFTSMSLFEIKQGELTRGLIPFLIIFLFALLLITYIPAISLALPNLM